MKYQLFNHRLRVNKILASENKELLSGCSILLLQHLFEDTLEFVDYVTENGGSIYKIIGKSYSVDKKVLKKLKEAKIPVELLDVKKSEQDPNYLLEILIEALKAAKKQHRRLILHEVGGFFSTVINKIPGELRDVFAGVVEDTTYGYNRYKLVEKSLEFPVFHVARSQLKEIEAVFVGEAVVLAFNNMMREIGVSIPGRNALVIGYGMIGKNIAKFLQRNNIQVTVFDIDHVRLLHAFTDGYRVIQSKEALDQFDIIFSATGFTTITLNDMKKMKDGVIFASGGSQDIEFDMKSLKKEAKSVQDINSEIKTFLLGKKQIVVLREGTPINFREKSVPTEVIDIVYAEILSCIIELLKKDYAPGMHEVPKEVLNNIARHWINNL